MIQPGGVGPPKMHLVFCLKKTHLEFLQNRPNNARTDSGKPTPAIRMFSAIEAQAQAECKKK